MGEEGALAVVQGPDGHHVLLAELEVKDVQVLRHPLLVGGLRDDHHVALDQKTQGGLGHGLAVLGADGLEGGVGEEVLPSLGEGAPGLVDHAVLGHHLMGGGLLEEGVGLHLVHHGLDLRKLAQVDEPVGVEVGHADGPDLPRLVELRHGPPGVPVDGLPIVELVGGGGPVDSYSANSSFSIR